MNGYKIHTSLMQKVKVFSTLHWESLMQPLKNPWFRSVLCKYVVFCISLGVHIYQFISSSSKGILTFKIF